MLNFCLKYSGHYTINWLKTGELRDCYIYGAKEKITEEAINNSSAKLFPIDTLLIAMYGATIGQTAYLKTECATNQACCAIIFDKKLANPFFYWKYFYFIKDTLIGLGRGAGQPNISQGIIKELKIPLPPLKEQEKIANILSTADEKIDAIASQIQKTETLKIGLLQKLLSEGINHCEFKDSELGKIPESWEVGKLGAMSAHISYGLTVRPKYIKDGIPLISATEIKDGLIDYKNAPKISNNDFNKLSDKAKPMKGDIFLSKTGTIGRVAYVQSNKVIAITQNIAVIRLEDKKYFQKFIIQYMTTSNFQKSAIKKVNQSTIMDLQLQDIKKLLIPLPPLKEQKQIAEILSTADEKLEVLRAKKEKYEELKKGLLQKLLSGEIRV